MSESPASPGGAAESAPPASSESVQVPPNGFRIFVQVLVNTAVANVTTSFLWFALTFWIYAESRNVIATGVIGASYMLFVSLFSMFFGTMVDRFRKKSVIGSSHPPSASRGISRQLRSATACYRCKQVRQSI